MAKVPLTIRVDPKIEHALKLYCAMARKRKTSVVVREHLQPLFSAALDFMQEQERERNGDK